MTSPPPPSPPPPPRRSPDRDPSGRPRPALPATAGRGSPATGGGATLTCREVIEFLMAYLDGELPSPQRAAFERHLSVCPSCVNYLATYREAVRLGRTALTGVAPAAPAQGAMPEGLVRAILAARRAQA